METVPGQPDPAADADVQTGTSGDIARPLIAEVRAKLAELAARELAVRQREQELDEQLRRLQLEARAAARREWEQAQQRLQQRSQELDAQAVELAARAARLRELEERLAQQEAELEASRRELTAQLDHLRRRTENLRALRRSDQQMLRNRIAVIRRHEQELERRIALAHADIQQQRQELDQQRRELAQRELRLAEAESRLAARQGAVESDSAKLKAQAEELAQRRAQLRAAYERFQRRRQELEALAQKLSEQQELLAAQRRELEQRWRTTRQQKHELTQQEQELEARQRLLAEQEQAHKERQLRLENYEQQLRARAASLESELAQLSSVQAELEQQKRQAENLLQAARQRLAEAEQRREQAEARDAECRQRQLALELEAEELSRQRAALEQAQAEWDRHYADHQAQLERIRAALAAEIAAWQRQQRRRFAVPGRWWLRSGMLAAVAGTVAGLFWLTTERLRYRATLDLRVLVPPQEAPAALAAHELRLNSPAVIAELLSEPQLLALWQQARSGGAWHVLSEFPGSGDEATPARCKLMADGNDATVLRRLLEVLADRYVAAAADWTEPPEAVAQIATLRAQRQQLNNRLQLARAELSAAMRELETLAPEQARSQARSRLQELALEYQTRGQALAQARRQLAELETAPAPRGLVAPGELEQAIANDEMYQADLRELLGTAIQYRAELAAAWSQVAQPAEELRKILADFDQVIAEQRALEPPPAAAALLEKIGSELEAAVEQVSQFAQQWQQRLAQLTQADLSAGTDEALLEATGSLVRQQATAAQSAAELLKQVSDLTARCQQLVTTFTSRNAAGTRETVLSALLRGELGRLEESIARLRRVVDRPDTAANFQLDALDRQLRGLHGRLQRRQQTLRQALQAQADEQARQQLNERIQQLRELVAEDENQRQALLDQVNEQLEQVWQLDSQVLARQQVETKRQQYEAAVAELEAKLSEIDAQLSACTNAGPPARLEAGPVRVERLTGANRQRNAVLVGTAAFAAAWGLCVLMVLRFPSRRGSQAATLLEAIRPESTEDLPPGAD